MTVKLMAATVAASACVLLAAPAFAGQNYVEGDYLNLKASGVHGSVDGWQAGASFNSTPDAGAWGLQGDLSYADADGAPKEEYGARLTGFRQFDNGRAGLYGSYTNVFGASVWDGGGIAQYSLGKLTGSAMAGVGRDEQVGVNNWLLGMNVSYYIMPNLKLAGTWGYNKYDNGAGQDTVAGARIEWKPEQLPVSFLVGYTNDNLKNGAPQLNTVNVGLRFNFGGAKTVQERDQHGLIDDFKLLQHF